MPVELPGIFSGAKGKAFRIFVSSPGDLGDERLTCARVIERIKDELAQVARIESIFWEQEPLTADASFQDQIPLPSATDLVVIMIWSRLGYRLHSRYKEAEDSEAPTGTIFEFRNALRGRRTSADHRPDIMVYRKTAEPPKPSVKNEEAYLRTIEEWKKVESFFNSPYFREQGEGSFTGAFHTFQRTSDFEENIYAHLRKLIERRLDAASEDAARPRVWDCGSPFRGLEFFDFKHSPIFFGRSRAAAEVRDALRRQAGRGTAFVLVMGMSGGGKSSLVRAGVLPDLVAPGVIEGISLMTFDLSDKLEPIGRLDLLDDVNRRVRDYYQAFTGQEDNPDILRQRAVALGKQGDVLTGRGDLSGALKSYRDSLTITEKLANRDPSNALWQRDLSVGAEKVGDVLNAQGDLAGAHKSYRDSLAISQKLANQDPSNAGWQRDLSVSYNKVGDVLNAQGDLAGALKSYGDSLKISQKLANQDPSNADWQRDLSVSYNKVGGVLNAQGDLAGALKSYRDSLAIREKLANQDPSNVEWQDDLEISCCLVATALLRIDVASKPEARQLLERGRDILQNLERRNGLSAVEQRRLEAVKAALRRF